MTLARCKTHDVQQLVHILQIDPENITIDAAATAANSDAANGDDVEKSDGAVEEARQLTTTRLVQSKITHMMTAKATAAAVVPASRSPSQSTTEAPRKHPNPLLRGKRQASTDEKESTAAKQQKSE
jgi:hypothetical protein